MMEQTEMNAPGKQKVSQRVIAYESAAFAIIILLIWLDELIDIPALLLGAQRTPVNWKESLFESVIIAILGIIIIHYSRRMFQRMKYLEGILSVCSACKKIRVGDNTWKPIESIISERSDAVLSHGICPECAEKLYPQFNPYKKSQPPAGPPGSGD